MLLPDLEIKSQYRSDSDELARELRLAEQDLAHLPAAVAALDRLAALDRRHVLASFARLLRTD